MNPDLLIVRHACPVRPSGWLIALPTPVINAGDGRTNIRRRPCLTPLPCGSGWKLSAGAAFLIVGNILHSRVARSNIFLLNKMGATVRVCGPRTMMPHCVEHLGVEYVPRLVDAVRDVSDHDAAHSKRTPAGNPLSK